MAAYHRVYDMRVCHCEPGGRWWQPTTRFMTIHAVTCLESGISSGPLRSIYTNMGTFTFFYPATNYTDHLQQHKYVNNLTPHPNHHITTSTKALFLQCFEAVGCVI